MAAFRDLPSDRPAGAASTPRWRYPWVAGGLACLVVLAVTADRSVAFLPTGGVPHVSATQAEGDDAVTDQFLHQFRPLRKHPRRRQVLAAAVNTSATRNRLDPDLLFALVAVESGFDRRAVSRKGARGLGQVMFPTARAVAPRLVHRPGDLYDIHRNLAVTARHLRELVIAEDGDLRAALTVYHKGPHRRELPTRADDRYVGLICTYYASLKVRRRFEGTMTMAAGTTDSPED